MVKNLPANAGDIRDVGLIPGLGRSPGGRHGNPLQYSCLENPMDRGAWWAAVHRIAESDPTEACMHACTYILTNIDTHTLSNISYQASVMRSLEEQTLEE